MNLNHLYFSLFFIFLLFSSCSEQNKLKSSLVDFHTQQNELFQQWINPGPLAVTSKQDSLDLYLDFLLSFEEELKTIDTNRLEAPAYAIWQNELEAIQEERLRWENSFSDPSSFDLTLYFRTLASGQENDPQRLGQISTALELVPTHFEHAKNMITTPDPDKSALAVQQQLLFLRFLQIDLPDIVKNSQISGKELSTLEKRIKNAKMASKDYIGFCESLIFEYFDTTLTRPQLE